MLIIKRTLVVLTVWLCSTALLAQKITITEVNKKMSQGKQLGLMVFISRVSENDAEKEWNLA